MPKRISAHTLVVGSGKGGVGKSTVAVNLAVTLAQMGHRVGLLDADIYGPSIPIMLGLRQMAPQTISDSEGRERVLPLTKFGLSVMSVGFFIEEGRPSFWRGPMLHGVLQKMIEQVEWGELDFLLVDLPPGTGDVPLSLHQIMQIDGGLIVTTPQEVAMLDAIKALNSLEQLEIPILGIIENMSGSLFGEGKGEVLAHKFSLPLLAKIPLNSAICQGGDLGYPCAFHAGDNQIGQFFRDLGSELMELTQQNAIS